MVYIIELVMVNGETNRWNLTSEHRTDIPSTIKLDEVIFIDRGTPTQEVKRPYHVASYVVAVEDEGDIKTTFQRGVDLILNGRIVFENGKTNT
jgi:hypothetical protein